jgi:hypothetical protein
MSIEYRTQWKEGDKVVAFNAREWKEAGYDQPEGNGRFFQTAEILDLHITTKSSWGPGGEEIATLKWPDGRVSAGHFTEYFKPEGES